MTDMLLFRKPILYGKRKLESGLARDCVIRSAGVTLGYESLGVNFVGVLGLLY